MIIQPADINGSLISLGGAVAVADWMAVVGAVFAAAVPALPGQEVSTISDFFGGFVINVAPVGSGVDRAPFLVTYEPGHVYRYRYAFQLLLNSTGAAGNGSDPTSGHQDPDAMPLSLSALIRVHIHSRPQDPAQILGQLEVLEWRVQTVDVTPSLHLGSPVFFAFDIDPRSPTFASVCELVFHRSEPVWMRNAKRGMLRVWQAYLPPALLAMDKSVSKVHRIQDGAGRWCKVRSQWLDRGTDDLLLIQSTEETCEDPLKTEESRMQAQWGARISLQSNQRIESLLSKSSEIVTAVTVTEQRSSMLLGGGPLHAVTTMDGNGTMVLEDQDVEDNLTGNVTSLTQLVRQVTGWQVTAILSTSMSLENDEDMFAAAEKDLPASNAGMYEKLQQAVATIAMDRSASSALFAETVLWARQSKTIRRYLLSMLNQPQLRDVAIDIIVATGDLETLHRLRAEAFKSFDLNDILIRMLMGLAYLPPMDISFSFARSLTWSDDSAVRETALLCLGAMIGQRETFFGSLSPDAQDALVWLMDGYRATEKGEAKDVYVFSILNAKQLPATEQLVLDLFPSAQDRIKSFLLRTLSHFDASLLQISTRATLLRHYLDKKADEVLRVIAVEILIRDPVMKELEVIVESVKKEKNDHVWDQTLVLLKRYALSHQNDLSGYLDSCLPAIRNRPRTWWVWSHPVFERHEESFVTGDQSMGAYIGYDAVVHNPLSPVGSKKVVADSRSYARAVGWNQTFDVLDGQVTMRGNVQDSQSIEAFAVISLGGIIWRQCIDLLGNVCSRDTAAVLDAKFQDPSCIGTGEDIAFMEWSTILMTFATKVPLFWGVWLDMGVLGGLSLSLNARSKACLRSMEAEVVVTPDVGMDFYGNAGIDLYLARASARVVAKVMHSKIPFRAQLKLNQSPAVQFCANVHILQKPLQASLETAVQLRDHLIRCGPIVCGADWGREWRWQRRWNGFRNGSLVWDHDMVDYCRSMFNGTV